MTRGIQRLVGVRQAHVSPALADALGTQLLTGDIREDPRSGLPENYAVLHESVPDGVNVKRIVFVNPSDSEHIAVLRRLHVYEAEDTAATLTTRSFVYNLIPQTGVVWNVSPKGQRLVNGYVSTVGGVAPPFVNPPSGLDIAFPPRPSRCGFHAVDLLGIDGGYIWRGLIGGTAGVEILEEFHRDYGPRIILFPGGTFQMYAIATDFHCYANMWWDEYPVT